MSFVWIRAPVNTCRVPKTKTWVAPNSPADAGVFVWGVGGVDDVCIKQRAAQCDAGDAPGARVLVRGDS